MLAALALAALARQEETPIALEAWVRAAALTPEAHAPALEAALVAPAWRERARALDALTRAASDGDPLPVSWRPVVQPALLDPHPSVRTRALELHGAAGFPLSAQTVARLASEPLASQRLALAQALEFTPSPGRAAWLERLTRDPDERVRAAAQNALTGLGATEEGVSEARLARLASLALADPEELARFLGQLALAELPQGFPARMRATLARGGPLARALGEAFLLARTGEGEAEVLVAGASREEAWEPVPARLLALARRARSAALGRACLRALADETLGARARAGLQELLLESLEPHGVAFLVAEGPPPALLAQLLEELGRRRDAWDEPEGQRLAAPEQPLEVRRALLGAVADGFTRSPQPGSEALLVRFLADPEPVLAARAFEVLCEARACAPATEVALQAVWRGLEGAEQDRRLAWFSRERPLRAFREDWLALGTRAERRAVACELLTGFESDEGVRAALAGWLAADLAEFREAPLPARALEQCVQAELRALARVDAGAAQAELRAALEGSLGKSHEIGKVAAAALGRSAQGRASLAELVATGALAADGDRRTRIEACIVLARSGEARAASEALSLEVRELACARLIEDREGAAWDLRERMLHALAAARVPSAEAELLRLALDPAVEPVERAALASLLNHDGIGGVRAVLCALVGGDFDLESRRVALQTLAVLREAPGLAALELEAERGLLPGSAEELAILKGELFLARLECEEGLDACARWLRAPLEQAGADLAQRQAGRELAATEFAWRHELALARRLARTRGVGPCLERIDGWERMDGRLLLALGEAVAGAEPSAGERLLAAAATALKGERDPDPGRAALCHVLRFRWGEAGAGAGDSRWLAARILSARRSGVLGDGRWALLARPGESAAELEARLRARAGVGPR